MELFVVSNLQKHESSLPDEKPYYTADLSNSTGKTFKNAQYLPNGHGFYIREEDSVNPIAGVIADKTIEQMRDGDVILVSHSIIPE